MSSHDSTGIEDLLFATLDAVSRHRVGQQEASHEQVAGLARASGATVEQIGTLLINPERLKLLVRRVMPPPRIRDCQRRFLRLCHYLLASRTRPAPAAPRPTIPEWAGRHAEFWCPPSPGHRPCL